MPTGPFPVPIQVTGTCWPTLSVIDIRRAGHHRREDENLNVSLAVQIAVGYHARLRVSGDDSRQPAGPGRRGRHVELAKHDPLFHRQLGRGWSNGRHGGSALLGQPRSPSLLGFRASLLRHLGGSWRSLLHRIHPQSVRDQHRSVHRRDTTPPTFGHSQRIPGWMYRRRGLAFVFRHFRCSVVRLEGTAQRRSVRLQRHQTNRICHILRFRFVLRTADNHIAGLLSRI